MQFKSLAAALVATGTLAFTGAAHADPVADFYKGKTVTVMVPSGLGATLGLYGRLVSEHIGAHIPGNPSVIITSRPGGGGTKGAAYAWNAAPRDGTYISEVLSASVLAGKLRNVKFDASKFAWIGSITPRPIVISTWHTSGVKTVEDARKKEVIMGSSGFGSETYMAPALMNALLGTKFKIVRGYKGGAAINKAIESGEAHGRMNYWSGWTAAKPHWLKEGKLHHLVQYGSVIKELPNVPRFSSLVKGDLESKMLAFMETSPKVGMGFWVHPQVPAVRIEALRKAFMGMVKDPQFLGNAAKRRAPVDPLTGEQVQKIVAEGYKASPAVIAELKKRLGFTSKK